MLWWYWATGGYWGSWKELTTPDMLTNKDKDKDEDNDKECVMVVLGFHQRRVLGELLLEGAYNSRHAYQQLDMLRVNLVELDEFS